MQSIRIHFILLTATHNCIYNKKNVWVIFCIIYSFVTVCREEKSFEFLFVESYIHNKHMRKSDNGITLQLVIYNEFACPLLLNI